MPSPNETYKKLVSGKRSKYGNVSTGSHDSKLESYFSSLLRLHRIPATEKQKITLLPAFTYNEEKIHGLSIEPDFFIYHDISDASDVLSCCAIVDTKHITEKIKNKNGSTREVKGTAEWRNKIKLLKAHLLSVGRSPVFYFPSTKKECDEVVLKLLEQTRR